MLNLKHIRRSAGCFVEGPRVSALVDGKAKAFNGGAVTRFLPLLASRPSAYHYPIRRAPGRLVLVRSPRGNRRRHGTHVLAPDYGGRPCALLFQRHSGACRNRRVRVALPPLRHAGEAPARRKESLRPRRDAN